MDGRRLSLSDWDGLALTERTAAGSEVTSLERRELPALLSSRFESSHTVELIESRRRYVGDYPPLAEVPRVDYIDRELGVNEFRPVRISWAVLRPR